MNVFLLQGAHDYPDQADRPAELFAVITDKEFWQVHADVYSVSYQTTDSNIPFDSSCNPMHMQDVIREMRSLGYTIIATGVPGLGGVTPISVTCQNPYAADYEYER